MKYYRLVNIGYEWVNPELGTIYECLYDAMADAEEGTELLCFYNGKYCSSCIAWEDEELEDA